MQNTHNPLANYQVLRVIGKGGMGTVYLARHKQIDRKVAIKELNPQFVREPSIRQRFKNEAALMANLTHPSIVSLHDYVESPTGVYLIMEYIEGITLDYYIHQVSGPIPSHRAIEVFVKILDAVGYAHARGIIHRDIKPANIMIGPTGDIKVLDFGIAKNLLVNERELTQTGVRMGTIYYMSPEQIRTQELDTRSDIYSLGITLFEMLTGRNPYSSQLSEFDISHKIVHEELPRARDIYPNISPHIQEILDRATAKDPDQRFQRVEDFKNALLGNAPASQRNIEGNTVEWIIEPLQSGESSDSWQNKEEDTSEPEYQEPERVLMRNSFGKVSSRKLGYYRGKDLFESGKVGEVGLHKLISARLDTHREIVSGLVFWTLAGLLAYFLFHWITLIMVAFLLVFGGICFAPFPTVTIVSIDLKKLKMRAWPWQIRSASAYVHYLNEALDRRE